MNIQKIKQQIENLKCAIASFVAFEYTDKDGEKTKRLINISVSYKNAVKKDIDIVKGIVPVNELEEQAKSELLISKVLSYRKILSSEITDLLIYLRQVHNSNDYAETQKRISELTDEVSVIDRSYNIPLKEKQAHENHSSGQSGAYINICNGLRYNIETDKMYVNGFSVRKTIVEAVEKADTRKPLTKAKDHFRVMLKSEKYRNFCLENIEGNMRLNGEVLEIS